MPETTREQFFALFRSLRGQSVYVTRRGTVMPARVEAAARMMQSGVSRTEAIKRLMSIYGISHDTASRDTVQVLRQQLHIPAARRTETGATAP